MDMWGLHIETEPSTNPSPHTRRPLSRTQQMVGDELRLKLDSLTARAWGKPWEGTGNVLRIADGEVALEMRNNVVPGEITEVRRLCIMFVSE
jgi:RNA helicase UPF1, 1B domain